MKLRQARLLYRFFLGRFFETDAGGIAPGAAVVLLALPGTIVALILMEKYSALARYGRRMFVWDPNLASVGDKYLFVVLSFVIVSIVTALRQDALFPDRRDHANLAALPISALVILASKAAALTVFVAAILLAVNGIATLVFPAVVLESGGTTAILGTFMAAHFVATMAAGLFAFSGVLTAQGLLMLCLPWAVFRRVRRYWQFAIIALNVALFLAVPACTEELSILQKGQASQVHWIPTVWFLGLYVDLQGLSMGTLNTFGGRAVSGTALLCAGAALAWLASWQRTFLKSAELPPEGNAGLRIPDRVFTILDGWLLTTPFERGCFRFVVRTVARSDRHSALFAAVLGTGSVVAAASFNLKGLFADFVPVGVLAPCLMLIYAALTALRLTLSVPADANAVWLFRVISDGSADPHRIAVRILWCLAAPLVAVSALLIGVVYGPAAGVLHLLFSAVLSAAFTEALTASFRILPFACAWMPARNNILLGIAGWCSGLAMFGYGLAVFEAAYLRAPSQLIWFVLLAAGLLWLIRRNVHARESVAWTDTRGDF
ncbi:MAG TPA: hypothetical protein VES20_24190, partial [Bryobacteraceae bacterium]|nr:hypothetical protein [Bryobacteraceae bacterium]